MSKILRFVSTYLLTMPILIKIHQLHLAEIPLSKWWVSFTWECVWVLAIFGILSLSKKIVRLPLLAGAWFVSTLLTINHAGFVRFGVFYKDGHLEISSFHHMFQAFTAFLTLDLLSQILVLQIACFTVHLLIYLAWQKLRPKPSWIAGFTACYIAVGYAFVPIQFEEQAMSLVVTASSFFESPPKVMSFDTSSLLNGSDPDFGLKPPTALEDLLGDKRYNLIVYPMESVRASSSSSYGCSAPTTPFLDRMQDRGIFFERCYSNAVRSVKALTTFTLGIYPYHSRSAWTPRPIEKALGDRHLPGILHRYGYYATFFVNSHISFDGREKFLNRLGFDEFLGTETFISSDDSVLVDQLDAFFRAADAQDRPLLSLLLPSSGHAPYPVATNAISYAMAKREALRVGAKNPKHLHRYLNAVHHQDQVAEKLYQYLEKTGRLKNTIFVVLGDHGESFGEHGVLGGFGLHGASLFEESIHVPAWIHHPDLEPRRVKEPVQFLDMLPTWLAMMGFSLKDAFPGRNVLVEPREKLFFMNHAKRYVTGVLADRYKLIAYEEPGDSERFFQLFDLEKDPMEKSPLGKRHPVFPSLAQSLEKANRYFPAIQEVFKQQVKQPLKPEAEDLPAWAKMFHGEIQTLPEGHYVLPHIPKYESHFQLKLELTQAGVMPARMNLQFWDRTGNLLGEKTYRTWFADRLVVLLPDEFLHAEYATLVLSRNARLDAHLRWSTSQVAYPLLNQYSPRTVFFGKAGRGQGLGLALTNALDQDQRIKILFQVDGKVVQEISKPISARQKELIHLPFPEGDEIKVILEGSAGVFPWAFRWTEGLEAFR